MTQKKEKLSPNRKRAVIIALAVVIAALAIVKVLASAFRPKEMPPANSVVSDGVADVTPSQPVEPTQSLGPVSELDEYNTGSHRPEEMPAAPLETAQQYTMDAVEGTDGHAYAIFDYREESLDGYDTCEAFCEDMGGHLAVIGSQEENDFLYDLVVNSGLNVCFFGYSDRREEGNWQWVNGETGGYTNWADGQPNNGANNANDQEEDYAEFFQQREDGTWNDAPFGANTWHFICEWE